MEPMMTKALACARRGWAVHPLYPRRITPATPNGYFDATRDPEGVVDLWEAMPGANIGVRCGAASGVWVLAVHGASGANALKGYETLHERLPKTLEVGGQNLRYLYFAWWSSLPIYGALHLAKGLEVYGEGGFVAGPGSIMPNGHRYTVRNNLPIVQAPFWLWQRIKDTSRVRLVRNRNGAIRSTIGNRFTALTQDHELAHILRFNTFEGRPYLLQSPPWECSSLHSYPRPIEHQDVVGAMAWLERRYNDARWTLRNVGEVIHAAAWVHGEIHPIREYLQGLTWDGMTRCDRWLSDYLGAPSTDFVHAVSAKWLISAVARIFRPGCRADGILALEGLERASEALRILAGPDRFYDNLTSLTSHHAATELRGVWVSCLRQTKKENAKSTIAHAFLRRQSDRCHLKHARHSMMYPRQCVFAICRQYLGSQKNVSDLWVVPCSRLDEDGLRSVRDQILAEACHRYYSGESWELDTIASKQDIHPWVIKLQSWAREQTEVTTKQALTQLGIRPADQTRRHQMIAGRVLRRLGFERVEQRRVPGSKTLRQRWYIRAFGEMATLANSIERTNR